MNDQLKSILEQQLRDVQSPGAIAWWPLAYGWWGIILIVFCIFAFSIFKFRKYRQQNAHRKTAVTELNRHFSIWQEQQENSAYLQAANALIKRACLHFGNDATQLSGEPWLVYLNAYCKTPFSKETSAALAHQLYQKDADTNITEVHSQIENWLLKHSIKRTQQSDQAMELEHA